MVGPTTFTVFGLLVADASAVPDRCPPVYGNGTDVTLFSTTTSVPSASERFARCQHATMAFALLLAFLLLKNLFAAVAM